MFFQVSSDFQQQIRNLMKKQETLHTNFSTRLQDMKDNLCLKGEEKNKNNGPSCILCPVNWQWMGGDTCFYISMQKKSWEESRQFCSLQNSTLLMLKDREKLNHVPPRDKSQYYWIGLHKSESAGWLWEDGSDLLTEKADWIGSYQFYRCGYLHGLMISNHDYCTMKHFWICEKAVFKLST
nr:natural killer cells antigen CD94-like isoform X2 [Pelodiscus sinensis]XP_025041854.1 natural killer cells antigen CD94-like isoform X2 [Pelodiscus sinensis]|eukprot:XP_025041853.1 natural killer cells antigen CD94-like isoform X2 [Pelodiscus sinensis]